ncbi:MAG: GAP family protein [Actinomycetes bacterium]
MNGLAPLMVRVGPLALGAACSPAVLLVQMMVLTRGTARVARAWLYALGTLTMTAVWMACGILAFQATGQRPAPSPEARTTSAVVHLVGAALLLALALRNFYTPESEVSEDKVGADEAAPHYLKAFVLGIGIMAANVTTVVLLLPATHTVAASRAEVPAKALACAVLAVAAAAPALLPPLLVALGGPAGRRRLDRTAAWMQQHQHRINAVVCVAFAAYLGTTGALKLG